MTEEPPAAGPRDGMADRKTALGEYVNRILSAVHVKPPSIDTSSATEPPTEAEAGERQTTEPEDTNIAGTLKNCKCDIYRVEANIFYAVPTHCAMEPNLHIVQEFKKPDPVTVTEVPPSKEPKLGKIDSTWEVAVACCA